MEIDILYEDPDVVIIDKPSRVMVHADGRSQTGDTIADWHLARIPTAQGVGEEMTLPDGTSLDRPGIVHRLDSETSGVLVLAKHQAAFEYLKKQFHDRQAQKEYRAFVYGYIKEEKGVIDRPIGRSAKDFRLKSAQRGARGVLRDAYTEWVRLATVRDTSEIDGGYSYLSLKPKTGRTHQLRVHAKSINHPIVHDRLYAPVHVRRNPHALDFTRLALHAHTLTITLPSGVHETFTAPLPDEFLRAAQQLEREGEV